MNMNISKLVTIFLLGLVFVFPRYSLGQNQGGSWWQELLKRPVPSQLQKIKIPTKAGLFDPCAVDDNCGAGLVCKDSICKVSKGPGIASCKTDTECAKGLICVNGTFCAQPCKEESECQEGFVCATWAGFCALPWGGPKNVGEACTSGIPSEECGAGLLCEYGLCKVAGGGSPPASEETNQDLEDGTEPYGATKEELIDFATSLWGPSLSVAEEQPHVVYYHKDTEGYRYATKKSNKWVIEKLPFDLDYIRDSFEYILPFFYPYGDALHSALVDSSQKIHIFISLNLNPAGYLIYLTNKSGVWVIKTIDSTSGPEFTYYNMSKAHPLFDSEGNLHVFYSKNDYQEMHAVLKDGKWMIEEGGSPTMIGADVDAAGKFHFMEANPNSHTAAHCSGVPGSWTCDKLPGQYYSLSFSLDPKGNPHIVAVPYYDHDVVYLTMKGGKWSQKVIEEKKGFGDNGSDTARIDTDALGFQHIIYERGYFNPAYDGDNFVGDEWEIIYRSNASGQWTGRLIAKGLKGEPTLSKIKVDPKGNLHLVYYNEKAGALQYVTAKVGYLKKPFGLEIKEVGPKVVKLHWSYYLEEINKLDGFKVERIKWGTGKWVEVAVIGLKPFLNTFEIYYDYSDPNVEPNSTYSYRVRPYNFAGAFGWLEATVKTPAQGEEESGPPPKGKKSKFDKVFYPIKNLFKKSPPPKPPN